MPWEKLPGSFPTPFPNSPLSQQPHFPSPAPLQVQKDFWVHKRYPQIVAVSTEIVHLGHTHSWTKISRSLHPKEPLDHQPTGQIMKGNLSDYFLSLKNSYQKAVSPPVHQKSWYTEVPYLKFKYSASIEPSTDNNTGSFYVLYYKSTAEINEPCSGWTKPLSFVQLLLEMF